MQKVILERPPKGFSSLRINQSSPDAAAHRRMDLRCAYAQFPGDFRIRPQSSFQQQLKQNDDIQALGNHKDILFANSE
jgi:hypothetical protein